MEQPLQERIDRWLNGPYDDQTKQAIRSLQKDHPKELADAFYQDLEFGTGGLRGLMGVGTNRMNKYTVGAATQGFANYIKKSFPGPARIAIAHDSRNNSRFFAETAASILEANGLEVFLFEDLRPTPELSFAIRRLGCNAGIVCTASHNPKEYNGYKAYWQDGGQLVPPHDRNVILEVVQIASPDQVQWGKNLDGVQILGKPMDELYIQMVRGLSVNPEVIATQHDLKIVYTPIHGTGITLVPPVLRALGFDSVDIVKEQATPDGNFPTVVNPNPEEPEAMAMGLEKARRTQADILAGTDPDADRVGIGVKDLQGNYILLNGNQTAVLAFSYQIEARRIKGIARKNDYVCKTIVTTDLIDRIAADNGVACYNTLTGFKYIAEMIREKEAKEHFIIGGEESYGLLTGDQVRDKDAVSAVALICEMAAYEKQQGRSLFEKLLELYTRYGMYLEKLVSITRKGREGAQQITEMMTAFRNKPPGLIHESPLVRVLDYQTGKARDLSAGTEVPILLPRSNVLQFILEDGSKISARPSGTEPKIKFYFSVNTALSGVAAYPETLRRLEERIAGINRDLHLE
ncbi:MAG TPA: phospho-sugar mutase [Chitinophagaceae bacterium]|nr:phospho-sugar mutase [Chitinophagaceae bacterium]